MSFYGLVLLIAVLMIVIYISAFLNEVGAMSAIGSAYSESAQIIYQRALSLGV